MKKSVGLLGVIAFVSSVAPAADGTWLNNAAGGNWNVAANWVDGVIPGDGGVATIYFADGSVNNSVTGSVPVTISELHWSTPPVENHNLDSAYTGTCLTFVPPAKIVRGGRSLIFDSDTIACAGDLTVSGFARTIFRESQNLGGRLVVENGAWVRVADDSSLGPVPATLKSDAIVLDGGMLQNSNLKMNKDVADTAVGALRGITVTENGGTFAAGFMGLSKLEILGPITGPGSVGVMYEFSPVVFSNPGNDWRGDLRIGVTHPGISEMAWSVAHGLYLGADEVIPHGEGRGVVYIAPEAHPANLLKQAKFDLCGYTETVNAVNASHRGSVESSTPGGVLKTCGAQDMIFSGQIASGATLELRGTGHMELTAASAAVSGTLALYDGSLDFAAGAISKGGCLALCGGAATLAARVNETNATLAYASDFDGTVFLGADSVVTIDPAAGAVAFRGFLTTDETNPKTLTIANPGNVPVTFGGVHSTQSAVYGAPVVCESGVTFTNYVWLKNSTLPANHAIAANAMITYDAPGVLANDLTLASDIRIATDDPGNGTVTVPTGRTLVFTTQSAGGGILTDPADGSRTYANNVILAGGTLAFDGAGTTCFDGAVSGYGTICQAGTGTVVFGNGQNLESGCTIEISNGIFRVPATGSLGAAKILTHGGRLANVIGESVTIPNAVTADSGGFQTDGAEAVMTLTGTIVYRMPVSKWGDGLLRVVAGAANTLAIYVRGGTFAPAGQRAVSSVIGCAIGCVVRLESDGVFGSDGGVALNGGTLDLNGHDLCLMNLTTRAADCRIINSAATPVTLTVTDDVNQTVRADIAGALTLVKEGTGTWNFAEAKLSNTGMRATNGGLAFGTPSAACGTHIRFTATESRPNGEWMNSGIQISEFRLKSNGSIVSWPDGTTASDGRTNPTLNEGAMKAIDGDTGTKWYYSGTGTKTLTITCPEPVAFDAYCFVTANDAAGRDPVSWKVEVGTLAGEEVAWKLLDEQTGQGSVVPMGRYTPAPSYSVRGRQGQSVLPAGYELEVGALAAVSFENTVDVLTALSGSGRFVARGENSPTIAAGSTFSGSVSAESPVALAYDAEAIPGMTAEAGAVFVNNGVAGALSFSNADVRTITGALKDGTAPLGVVVAGESVLLMAGAGSTYSGETRVETGSGILTGAERLARHFRFSPIKGSGGNVRYNMQLSELRLLRGGVYEPWPAGSSAVAQGDNTDSNHGAPEGALQLLDGDVETKCYWGGTVGPVYITVPKPVSFDGYCWYTGNDSMEVRNPVRWTFEYSLDGKDWVVFDDRSQEDVETTMSTKTLAYTFDVADAGVVPADALSDNSALVLASGASAVASAVEETLGSLSGEGTFALSLGAVARLNVTTDAVFPGEVSGVGVLAKKGPAKQSLTGKVALAGELVVEEGELNLDGAMLTGVTNIVLKGGVLTGAATVNGDLTVTSEGGAYGASLTVTGALTLAGVPTIATGYASAAVRGTAFVCGSADAASRALFLQAAASESIPKGWKFSAMAQSSKFAWSVAQGSTVIFIR